LVLLYRIPESLVIPRYAAQGSPRLFIVAFPSQAGGQRFSLINLLSITWSETPKCLAMP
jgi:hypothetical protein